MTTMLKLSKTLRQVPTITPLLEIRVDSEEKVKLTIKKG